MESTTMTRTDLTEMEEYVEFCMDSRQNKTAMPLDRLCRALLGLSAEVGELQGLMEKAIRREKIPNYKMMSDELGDIIHLWATVVGELGLNPDDIIIDNIQKVVERRKEGYYGKALATS